jgi:hypothetical protein
VDLALLRDDLSVEKLEYLKELHGTPQSHERRGPLVAAQRCA